jgi:hypothetical protein
MISMYPRRLLALLRGCRTDEILGIRLSGKNSRFWTRPALTSLLDVRKRS